MIVAEERDSNEVVRFLVLDAYAKLGEVQYGSEMQEFDPPRLFQYYANVENQLFDFASKYSDSFLYLPRRAYSYLSKPPLLGDISSNMTVNGEMNWMVDQFMIHPLVEISERELPRYQKKGNIGLCHSWTMKSEYSPRLYDVVDLNVDDKIDSSWAAAIDAADLSTRIKGPLRNRLLEYATSRSPIHVRLQNKEEIPPLLEWLVLLKDSGIDSPALLFSIKDHRKWGDEILKLLQMPNSQLLSSGTTISSLSTLINKLKETLSKGSWSEKIVFSSSYPETQMGDSLTEIISYLLSRNLGASKSEIQRVLGGNILKQVPLSSKKMRMEYVERSLFAEGIFGKSAFREFLRLLRLLNVQKHSHIVSCCMLTENDGGQIDFNTMMLTSNDLQREKYRRIILHKTRDESLRLVGWQSSFDKLLETQDWVNLRTKVRAFDKGPVLDAPSHIPTFNMIALDLLGVKDSKNVLSSLHYGVIGDSIPSGKIGFCDEDRKAIGMKYGDIVTVLDPDSDHYWGATAEKSDHCPSKKVVLSSKDIVKFGITDDTQIDLVKYTEDIAEFDDVLLTFTSTPGYTDSEIALSLHMHSDTIKKSIKGSMVGVGTRFVTPNGLEIEVKKTKPRMRRGVLGRTENAFVKIIPNEFLNELNMILIVSNGNEMRVRDMELLNPVAIRKSLEDIQLEISEVRDLAESITKVQSRWNAASLMSLDIVQALRYNQSAGKIGLVFVEKKPHKFTIQKGLETQEYINLDGDMQNEEIFNTLVYSILDASETSDNDTDSSVFFRSMAEMLEDIGTDRPTLILLFTAGIVENQDSTPYLRVVQSSSNFKLLVFGLGKEFNEQGVKTLLQDLEADVIHLDNYSIFKVREKIVSEIRELCHS